jgi:predicted amidophosphoribosyltransferase
VERGYNQAALLAAYVARELRAPLVTTALARKIDTVAQVTLAAAERQSNLAAAIHLTPGAAVEGRACVLVDDVSTTGATLGACRDALFDGGARRVRSVVLAHSSSGDPRIPLGLDTGPVLDIGVKPGSASSGCAFAPLRANLRN